MPSLDSAKASTKASLGAGKERLNNSRVRHPTKFFKKDNGPEYLERAYNHQSTPLRSLNDPDKFGPPPKTNTAGLSLSSDRPRPPSRSSTSESAPRIAAAPFQRDTTGLDTRSLPKPPTRNAESNTPPPLPPQSARSPPPAIPSRSQPPIPPRLPQRTSTLPAASIATERPPELPPPPAYSATAPSTQTENLPTSNTQFNELASRFNRLRPTFSDAAPSPSPPLPSRSNTGTATPDSTIIPAQPVVAPDLASGPARPAWSVQRPAVNNMSQLKQNLPQQRSSGLGAASLGNAVSAAVALKKPPPPPPPAKKRDLVAQAVGASDASTPPPVPLSSKPKF